MRTDDTLWVLPDRYGTPCGALWCPDVVLVLDWCSSDHPRSTSRPHTASDHNFQIRLHTRYRASAGLIRSPLCLWYPQHGIACYVFQKIPLTSQSIAAKANGDRNTPAGCILLVFTCTDSVKTKALRPPDLDAEPQSSGQRQGSIPSMYFPTSGRRTPLGRDNAKSSYGARGQQMRQ